MNSGTSRTVIVNIASKFAQYVEPAILRLEARHPTLSFAISSDGICVSGIQDADHSGLRKEILHAVYREKVYAETLPLRHALIRAVTSK